MNMASWLESVPSETPTVHHGSDGFDNSSSWWVPDMFAAPPTQVMPRTQSPQPEPAYQAPAPAPKSYSLVYRASLKPELVQEAMKRMRVLRPRRALVCAMEADGSLTLKACAGGDKAAQPPDASRSLMLHQVLETEQPVVCYEANWTVCTPLRDRRDRLVGVLLVEGTAERVLPEALGKLVRWAQNQPEPAPILPARRPRPGGCRRLPVRELASLLRSLSTMCASGLTLTRSLSHLAGSAGHPGVAELCEGLDHDLNQGTSFSRAASRHPKVFSAVHLGLLRVGESTGRLDKILGRLADYEEKKSAALLKLQRALTYPAALLMVIVPVDGSTGPTVLTRGPFPVDPGIGSAGPWLTRLLMGFSSLMRTPWPCCSWVDCCPLSSLWVGALQSEQASTLADAAFAGRSQTGHARAHGPANRFARALSLQVEAGGSLLESVHLAGQACGNPLMSELSVQIGKSIYAGKGLARSLGVTRFFTPMFLAVMQTAEEVGEIDKLTHWLADLGDQEMERNLDTVSALMEPLVMLLLGVLVGVMILATMLPLASALQAF
ncbi:MAG: type II secretion system F family protein [Vulcanimicrobiota bacterium]